MCARMVSCNVVLQTVSSLFLVAPSHLSSDSRGTMPNRTSQPSFLPEKWTPLSYTGHTGRGGAGQEEGTGRTASASKDKASCEHWCTSKGSTWGVEC